VSDGGNGFAPRRPTHSLSAGLEVDLGAELRLPTPVLAASGCFNTGREMASLIDLGALGGVVSKSVTLQPRKGLPVPRMAETPSGMLNAIGLQNTGVEEFLSKEGPWIAALAAPVIVSVAGRSVEEYSQVVLRVKDLPGVVAIEANISCPNVERRNQVFACHPDQAAEVIGAVSRLTRLPVFAKLTADTTSVVEVAEACVRAGAHGLSLINTLLGMAVDVETFRAKLGAVTGGLSGPAIKPVAVRCVYQVAQALPGVPIMGIGGIRSAEDAAEFLLAGAWAVQVGTANFIDPDAIPRITEGLRAFLDRHGLERPSDLVGRVRALDRAAQPAHRRG
jgi:dihydroorotate dehydrogenase (NAD+) catalytic subunit